MIVTTVHLIRLDDIDNATSAPLDSHVRVDLGDAQQISYNDGHRIRGLVWGAKYVQLVGAHPSAVRSVLNHLDDQADVEAGVA